MSAAAFAAAPPATAVRARRRYRLDGAVGVFLLVFAAQTAFGVWMSSRGFRWGDAFYRSTGALFAVHSADAKLANIGFVWMPLPAILNLPFVSLYPFWREVVSSGAASSLSSAVCGGATAAILVVTARRLGLAAWVGWAFALLVSVNPMIFLYAGSGMAEGVGAPFLVAGVCFLTLFWRSGHRWWIAAAGVAVALAILSLYEAVPFGAAIVVALAAGVLWSSEARPSAPQGRLRAVGGLGLLVTVPPVFAGLLWIVANATIMGQPLFFLNGAYGYATYKSDAFTGGSENVAGDVAGIVTLVGERIWPFLIPVAAILLVRALDRRLLRVESLSLVAIALSVTLVLVAPMAYLGSRMDFLRYHMFPLYAAAGWGLYEIAISARRRRATGLVLGGWVLAIPACLWVMANPGLAPQEYPELKALAENRSALQLGYGDPVITRASIAHYLGDRVLSRGQHVLLDSYQGAAIAAQLPADQSRNLLMTFDHRFRDALADPVQHDVAYVLIPDPATWPQDIVARTRRKLWAGKEPGFVLAKEFKPGGASRLPEKWRLYAVRPDARVLATTTGGSG